MLLLTLLALFFLALGRSTLERPEGAARTVLRGFREFQGFSARQAALHERHLRGLQRRR